MCRFDGDQAFLNDVISIALCLKVVLSLPVEIFTLNRPHVGTTWHVYLTTMCRKKLRRPPFINILCFPFDRKWT